MYSSRFNTNPQILFKNGKKISRYLTYSNEELAQEHWKAFVETYNPEWIFHGHKSTFFELNNKEGLYTNICTTAPFNDAEETSCPSKI